MLAIAVERNSHFLPFWVSAILQTSLHMQTLFIKMAYRESFFLKALASVTTVLIFVAWLLKGRWGLHKIQKLHAWARNKYEAFWFNKDNTPFATSTGTSGKWIQKIWSLGWGSNSAMCWQSSLQELKKITSKYPENRPKNVLDCFNNFVFQPSVIPLHNKQ